RNSDDKETCIWNSGSVNIENGIAYFEDTHFANLVDGALKINSNGVVTLKDTVLFYGNKPNNGYTGMQRNIICGGTNTQNAQILASASSFREISDNNEPGELSRNKWVIKDKETCKLTGSLSEEKLLLYSPLIEGFDSSSNKDMTGIDVEIKGKSLFKCGKLYIRATIRPYKQLNEEAQIIDYKLEDLATTWDSDTEVIAQIINHDLVQVGKRVTIELLVLNEDGIKQQADHVNEISGVIEYVT
ncbi:MAG: hypothetical protein EZS28_053987, partial [Streblomastix strix]